MERDNTPRKSALAGDRTGPKPVTADAQNGDYRFEWPVTFIHTSMQSRGSFAMEAKQGTGSDHAIGQLAFQFTLCGRELCEPLAL